MLTTKLKQANFSIQTKLLICVIANTYDGFLGRLETDFFSMHTDNEILENVLSLSFDSEHNKELVEMVADGEDDIDDHLAAQARMLKI